MAQSLYFMSNTAMQTTAQPTLVTTGTAIKTMLQALPTSAGSIVQWGVVTDIIPTAPVRCELVETGTIAATVTAHVAAGVQPYNRADMTGTAPFTLSTTGTGYTSSAEGTTVATRTFDFCNLINTNQYKWEWSQDREPEVLSLRLLRIRVLTTVAINMYCWFILNI